MSDQSEQPIHEPIHVIGAGLAGSEAAWQIARQGIRVILHEMRPVKPTPVHSGGDFAELVCSNSFRADDAETSAIGILHREMRRLGSLIMTAADQHQVPAGGALAVDRAGFAAHVTQAIESCPLIEIVRSEIEGLPPDDWGETIIATGPLTAPSLAAALKSLIGEEELAFFDAIAPIVHRDTIDMTQAWFQSRYDKAGPGGSGADYINCPLTKAQYEEFVADLIAAEKIAFKGFEDTPYFDGCLPIEIMAERGIETLRHGPMKPFGLTNPHAP
ncbi:MAG: methylenetetrahydrofolate--tRNA-(uracil(54)-C(5))-methyltransferase (FADH(2)-oxidizing) TrmFO, partial [Methylovirgula sp.]